MKKLFAALFIVLTACSPQKPFDATQIVATPTVLVIPSVTVTPAPTATPKILTPTPQPTPAVYVVQKGDTLTAIAEKYGVPVIYLADLNGINNPNVIGIGDVLLVEGQVNYPKAPVSEGKVILGVLGRQRVYVYENGILLKEFIVSSGRAGHETVTGTFRVQAKYTMAHMVGPDYDVMSPWTMYFGNDVTTWHEGYSLHGAPWNLDLGTPHSHGCLNMTVEDAKWLFDWTEPVSDGGITISPDTNTGTLVIITN